MRAGGEGAVREVRGQGGAMRGGSVAAAVPSGAEGGILDGEVQQESCGSGGERL